MGFSCSQRELYIFLAVMCVTKSAQGAGKLMFGVGIVLDREVQKCQNGVLDLEMRSKCRGHTILKQSYLGIFFNSDSKV